MLHECTWPCSIAILLLAVCLEFGSVLLPKSATSMATVASSYLVVMYEDSPPNEFPWPDSPGLLEVVEWK